MQAAEQVLIPLYLEDKRLVGCSHIFHLLIDQLLHLNQVGLVLRIHVVEVVM